MDIRKPHLNNIDNFPPKDVSNYVMMFGQFYYCFIIISLYFLENLFHLVVLSIFIWIYFCVYCFYSIVGIWAFKDIYNEIKWSKSEKDEVIKELIEKFYECDENNYEAKNFYLILIIELRSKPLYTIKSLSKILAIIVVVLSFIPFIS